jgi:hypothetical protein
MTELMTGYVKVTVDFLVKSETPEDAKKYLDSIMRGSKLPNYNIKSETKSASV